MVLRTFSIRAGLLASTVTPGSTAPDASLTVPVTAAAAVPCANAVRGNSIITSSRQNKPPSLCERLIGSSLTIARTRRSSPPVPYSPARDVVAVVDVPVADPVVRRAPVPHASLRVEEELPHRDFRVREWILGDLARVR